MQPAAAAVAAASGAAAAEVPTGERGADGAAAGTSATGGRADRMAPAAPRPTRTCASCGRAGSDLKSCTGCAVTRYCSRECQLAHWKEHKAECKRTRLVDAHTASPVFGAVFTAARMNTMRDEDHPTFHKVQSKEIKGSECHLHLGPNESMPIDALIFDMTKPTKAKLQTGADIPKGSTLAKMVLSDGDVFIMHTFRLPRAAQEAHVGMAVGFHNSILAYNGMHKGKKKLQLAYRGSPIVEYGICVGSHNTPDFTLVYHYPDGRVERRQDPQRHCWLYFASERKDCVYVDCCLLPFGYLGATDAARYVPRGGASEAEKVVDLMAAGGRLIAPMFVYDQQATRQVQALRDEQITATAAALDETSVLAHMVTETARVCVSDLEWDEAACPSWVDYVDRCLTNKLRQATDAAGPPRRPGEDRVLNREASLDVAIEYYMASEQVWRSVFNSECFKQYPPQLDIALFVMS